MNPKANRVRMCEVMFEEYGFGGVYVAIQAVLTLYAQGTCGLGCSWTCCLNDRKRFDDGSGGGFGRRCDAYRTRVRWIFDAASDAEVGYRGAGCDAVSDQAVVDAWVCVQSDG